MPPKGRPRGRQNPRNTRGAANNSESAQALSAPSPKEPLNTDDGVVDDISTELEHTSTPAMRCAEAASLSQPVSDPPSSDIPTSEPGPTAGSPPAARRSVQRLASVLPRSSSNAPSSSAGADGSEPRLASLKFKPKSNARRSKEEREAFERAEAERLAARQAAGDVADIADRGGFYGRGRGRGFSDMNRWKNERFNLSREASGHLGGATIREGTPRRGRGGWGGITGGHESGAGGGGGGGAGGAHSDSSNARVKNEPPVKPEKDRDGDVVMTSSTSNSKPKRAKVKKENQLATYVSSEGELDSDGGKKKKNIERINLISSDEDDDEEEIPRSEVAKGKQRERTPHIPNNLLRPIRIQRQEHVERSIGVNTDASSLTSAELRRRAIERHETGRSLIQSEDEAVILTTSKAKTRRKPRDVEFVRDERKWKGVYQDEDDKDPTVKVKDEPTDDNEMMVDEPPISSRERKDHDNAVVIDTPIPDSEPSPMTIDEKDSGVPLHTAIQEPIAQASENMEITETVDNSGGAPEDEVLPRPDQRPPRTSSYIGPEVVYTSEEDEQFLAELDAILAVQSGLEEEASGSKVAPSSRTQEEDGDIHMDNKAELVFLDDDEGRCGYVFQLPPIIPSLRDAAKKPTSPKLEKKPTTPKMSTSQPTSATPNNPFNVHPKNDPTIKSDPDAPAEPPYPNAYIAGGLNAPGGQAGVINIHSKGAMRVHWGGMSLEISKGESGSMIPQELVMTNFMSASTKVEDESRWEEKIDVGEKGWAMGQTQKGFVCVPDWASLLS